MIGAANNADYTLWEKKVRFLSRTQPLMPADIDNEVIGVIYQALFEGKQFRARYRRRDGDEAEYDVHPHGLVFRESVVYLVATLWNYKDLRHFAMHRFQRCTLLEAEALKPEGFELDSYIKGGSFEYMDVEGKKINLEIRFTDGAGYHLTETPISKDQLTKKDADGIIHVSATVKDSAQLRWWLLGFGEYVEILKPASLRKEFRNLAKRLSEKYSS